MSENRWQQRLENLSKAYEALSRAVERVEGAREDELLRAGIIQTYEFALELSWKTLRDYLLSQGFTDLDSPKKVLRIAFAEGYVKNGDGWMEALDDRNLSAHTYKKELADRLIADIANKYYGLVRELYGRLKQEAGRE